jgi:hypothetical protein
MATLAIENIILARTFIRPDEYVQSAHNHICLKATNLLFIRLSEGIARRPPSNLSFRGHELILAHLFGPSIIRFTLRAKHIPNRTSAFADLYAH